MATRYELEIVCYSSTGDAMWLQCEREREPSHQEAALPYPWHVVVVDSEHPDVSSIGF